MAIDGWKNNSTWLVKIWLYRAEERKKALVSMALASWQRTTEKEKPDDNIDIYHYERAAKNLEKNLEDYVKASPDFQESNSQANMKASLKEVDWAAIAAHTFSWFEPER